MNSIYIIAIVSILLLGAGAIVYFYLLKKNKSDLVLQSVGPVQVMVNNQEIKPQQNDCNIQYSCNYILELKDNDIVNINSGIGLATGQNYGWIALRGMLNGEPLPLPSNMVYAIDTSDVSKWLDSQNTSKIPQQLMSTVDNGFFNPAVSGVVISSLDFNYKFTNGKLVAL